MTLKASRVLQFDNTLNNGLALHLYDSCKTSRNARFMLFRVVCHVRCNESNNSKQSKQSKQSMMVLIHHATLASNTCTCWCQYTMHTLQNNAKVAYLKCYSKQSALMQTQQPAPAGWDVPILCRHSGLHPSAPSGLNHQTGVNRPL